MFGKVSTLMIALKIMLLCPWNYGSQYKKGEGDTTGVPCQGKEMEQFVRSRREYIAIIESLWDYKIWHCSQISDKQILENWWKTLSGKPVLNVWDCTNPQQLN